MPPTLDQIPGMYRGSGPQRITVFPAENPIEAKLYAAFMDNLVNLEWFAYGFEWNTLGASAVGAQDEIVIDQSTDFVIKKMGLISYSAVGTIVANPDYGLELRERSGAYNFSDSELHVGTWTGHEDANGGHVFTLPFPRRVKGNNSIIAFLSNRTATAARVNMALHGIRVEYKRISRETLFPY